MASRATPRGTKRVLQACDNCRRKKTRCPGEKPECSNCTRLSQSCQYSGSDFDDDRRGQISTRSVEDRLAQLEKKFDRLADNPSASPRQGETPPNCDVRRDSTTPTSPPAGSSLVPDRQTVADAISIYFRCGHRQPIWLFESSEELSPDSPEELLLTVLGLSIQYAPAEFDNVPVQAPSVYNDASRSLIMLQIASSSVSLSTLQALCLLVFSNLVLGDLQLASFHLSLLKTLLQSSSLDEPSSPERTRLLEDQRRLFWSFHTLDVLCGLPNRIPSLLVDIRAPQYLVPGDPSHKCSGPAPLLPQEIYSVQGERSLGIWAHMVRSASLWAQVRIYVWKCADGLSRMPWQPDSGYTAINAQLLDMECAFPNSYRYDSARFLERSSEEINSKRDFWLPWMKIQVTYHALHSILNHPFLYATRNSRPRPGPNAFWKTSTDLALLHSTWIARLIGLASKKCLALSDPFFAHAAAIAITLHLYWSRATDSKIRGPAQANLEICRSFLAEIGARWPICNSIVSQVPLLI